MITLAGNKKAKTSRRRRGGGGSCCRFQWLFLLTVMGGLILNHNLWRIPSPPGNTTSKVPNIGSKDGGSMSPQDVSKALFETGETPLYDANNNSSSSSSLLEPWKSELFQRLDRIRLVCGDLCRLNTVEAIQQHTVIDATTKAPILDVSMPHCDAILNLQDLDAGSLRCKNVTELTDLWPPELMPYYTLHQAVKLFPQKPRCDVYLHTKAGDKRLWQSGNVWKKDDIEMAMEEIRNGTHFGSYGVESVNYVKDILSQADVASKSILVIGSSAPWLEATLLLLGAAKVTTLEYGQLVSEHPQIVTMTPDVFRKEYQAGTLGLFDAVVHHSSLEHSGLGRYGDALNPWGDLLAVARAWCVTKEGGWMYAGLPSACHADEIMSNHHRIYNRLRWPLVTSGWVPKSEEYAKSFDMEREKGCIWGDKNGGEGHLFFKP